MQCSAKAHEISRSPVESLELVQHRAQLPGLWRWGVLLLLVFPSFAAKSAEPLLGSWQAAPFTNTIAGAVARVEKSAMFSNNGAFLWKEVIRVYTNSSVFSSTGTDRIIDTNQLALEFAIPFQGTKKQRFIVVYRIAGEELVLEDWSSFEPRTTTRYRRVMK